MTKSVKRLTQNLRVRLGTFPIEEFSKSDALRRSIFRKAWNLVKYPSEITSPVTVLTRPMMSKMSFQETQNIELSVLEVSGEGVEFYVQLVSSLQSPVEDLPYVSLLKQPLEAIRELHPDASQLAPLSIGADTSGAKLVLTKDRPNETSLQAAFFRSFGTSLEWELFKPNALPEKGPVTIIDTVKQATPPGTILRKPYSRSEVLYWALKRNGEECLKYQVGTNTKSLSVSDIEYSYSQLMVDGTFSREWFNKNLESSYDNPCHFTTLGAIFILLGTAKYGGYHTGAYLRI